MLAIEAQGLTKRYAGLLGRGGQDALRGLDLAIPGGTAFGLIGPNGAGKTTFVKALLGVVRPTSGTVRLLGGDPEDPKVRARVGYLPERLRLSPAWTPLEILESVARMKGVRLGPGGALRLLEEVGVAEAARRRTGGFSKGMRQRVGLAAALVGDPELLVLDEPTDGLDPIGRVEVRNLLGRALARGATLLLNSHLLAETERICGRVGILVGGRIVREGPLDALTATRPAWRVRFAPGAPGPALEAAGFVPDTQGAHRFAGEGPEALNLALDQARDAGALVVELTAESRDLEDVLAAAISSGSPPGAGGKAA
ncbi:MAG: ABC transporter ATP-binding protein [Anaeromyxobacteraceae bacterium]